MAVEVGFDVVENEINSSVDDVELVCPSSVVAFTVVFFCIGTHTPVLLGSVPVIPKQHQILSP